MRLAPHPTHHTASFVAPVPLPSLTSPPPPPPAPITHRPAPTLSPSHPPHAGGYLVFIAIEALRGKRVDEGVERAVQAGGFLLLMTAGVSLIVRDTLNLTGLGSMLQ